VAEDFHDRAGVGPLLVEQGRAGVAQVMETDLTDTGTDAQRVEGAVQVARFDGRAVLRGEDQVVAVALPVFAGRLLVRELLSALGT
jgi:hypothetical protein